MRSRPLAWLVASISVGAIAVLVTYEIAAPRLADDLQAAPAGASRSARLLVAEGDLWAGHAASRTVTRLALPDGGRVWQTDVGCEPASLARSPTRLFVACFDSGEIVALDQRDGAVRARARVGRGPFGALLAGRRLYVTLAHENALVALRVEGLSEIARAPTGRQPRGIALAGERLYVVHLLDASVRLFDARTLRTAGHIEIGQQAAVAESLTPHPRLPRLYVPHQRMHFTNLARQFDNTVFPVVSALDTEHLVPVRKETLALDSVDTPVGLPVAVALSADGSRLYTANAASDDVSAVDLVRGIGVGHVVVGHHPRDLALSPDGTRLYTLNLVSDDITVVETAGMIVVGTLALAQDPRTAVVQQGERLFSTSRPETVARDRWLSCVSCHLDGGFDGQTWLGGDDGPRNTPSLRGIRGTEPLHWSGNRPDVQSFQKTITGLMGGTGLSQASLDALAAFVNSLRPLGSPARAPDGALVRDAVEGATVFRRATCMSCHAPPLFTDRRLHDVGTDAPFHQNPSAAGKLPETRGPSFKTPSLRELWLTAPYLHDGRAATLREVLTTFNREDGHGATSTLSERELASLEAFLLSLPLTSEELSRLFGSGAREGR